MDNTQQLIQHRYDRFAWLYETSSGLLNWFGVVRYRQRVFREATGTILEVAIGTGRNLQFYPKESAVTAVDISQKMLSYARKRAARLGLGVKLQAADAAKLPFAASSFDTVTSSLSTCTFPDPVTVLKEMKRVCRPDGQILLLEHGRSSLGWVAKRQDNKAARRSAGDFHCWPNRDPVKLARQAGLVIEKVERPLWGYFYLIWARP